jgi:hypothetical protein
MESTPVIVGTSRRLEAKGTTMEYLPRFVKDKYGEAGYKRFVEKLSPKVKELFTSKIMTSEWYPLEDAVVEPTKAICDLFFAGDSHGAWEIGRFSADYALRGVYKLFIRMHDPLWTTRKAQVVFSNYYRPGEAVLVEANKNSAIIKYAHFPEKSGYVEQRIGGWVERAYEICGVRTRSVKIIKSYSRGDPHIEALFEWT